MRQRIIDEFQWVGDRTDWRWAADRRRWLLAPDIVGGIGAALLSLFAEERPTLVAGVASSGSTLAALVAAHAGIGAVEISKDAGRLTDSEAWWEATTPPDYRDRHLRLSVPRYALRSVDRVLFVDDWVETGAQATAARRLVEQSGARWIGAAAIVDGTDEPQVRRHLRLRSIVRRRELD